MANYSKTIGFRVSEEDYQLIAEAAASAGESISGWARHQTIGAGINNAASRGVAAQSLAAQSSSFASSTPSSTPQAVYNALEPRLSQLEEALKQSRQFIRKDQDANSNQEDN